MQLLQPAALFIQLTQVRSLLGGNFPFLSATSVFAHHRVHGIRRYTHLINKPLSIFTFPTEAGFKSKKPEAMEACAEVVLVPSLTDNYAYLFYDKKTKIAACVDAVEPEKVIEAAKRNGVSISKCLCTHRHLDHSGGNERIKILIPGIEVIGSAYESTPGRTVAVKDQDIFDIGDLQVKVLHTPCHTSGHVVYYVENRFDPNAIPVLFTGDTLFSGGCGRFFEGDAAAMHRALNITINALRPETLIYCGHEYTLSNLEFAASVDGGNKILQARRKWAEEQRKLNKPTIPSTIKEELLFNPFMRVDERGIQEAVGAPVGDAIQTMHILRQKKNIFK